MARVVNWPLVAAKYKRGFLEAAPTYLYKRSGSTQFVRGRVFVLSLDLLYGYFTQGESTPWTRPAYSVQLAGDGDIFLFAPGPDVGDAIALPNVADGSGTLDYTVRKIIYDYRGSANTLLRTTLVVARDA